jgi:hypothetical protein
MPEMDEELKGVQEDANRFAATQCNMEAKPVEEDVGGRKCKPPRE